MLDRFLQRDLGLWVFMCPTNNTLFCLYFVSILSLFCLYFLSLFCVSLSGYHAEGYHVPSLPPRAITPVYTSRLPHQSYHAPPIHVHRVITPAISYSYFVVLSFAGFYATCASPPTPPLGATRYNLLNMLVGANHFRGEQLEYLRVPAVFREYILRVLAVFRGSVLRILSILQVFRGSIPRILRYAQYSCCSYSQYSQYEMYSILRVYSKYEVYWEHLCKPVVVTLLRLPTGKPTDGITTTAAAARSNPACLGFVKCPD